jgi:hypothetical protein
VRMAEGFWVDALSLGRSWAESLCSRGQRARLPGGCSAVVPPVPIPNTVVKGRSADDTGGATRRDTRSPPGSFFPFPFHFPTLGCAVGAFFGILYASSPPSSSGLGHHPFKVKIAGSNPAGGTTSNKPAISSLCCPVSKIQVNACRAGDVDQPASAMASERQLRLSTVLALRNLAKPKVDRGPSRPRGCSWPGRNCPVGQRPAHRLMDPGTDVAPARPGRN